MSIEDTPGLWATISGVAMRQQGKIVIPEIFCRFDALPPTDEPIETGLPPINGPDGGDGGDGSPGVQEPPGAPDGDGPVGGPGTIFFDGDQLCIVQSDGTISCVTVVPATSAPPLASIAVFFDGGGAKLLNNTQIYHYLPFDATTQKLVVYTDGTAESDDVIVEVYRTPLSTWVPGDDLPPANKIATVSSDNGNPGVGLVDVELNADDTIVFETPLGSLGNVTKVHASLVVARR